MLAERRVCFVFIKIFYLKHLYIQQGHVSFFHISSNYTFSTILQLGQRKKEREIKERKKIRKKERKNEREIKERKKRITKKKGRAEGLKKIFIC